VRQTPGPLAFALTMVGALAITLVPQGVWSALIVTNLRTTPSVPWAVLVMSILIGVGFQYLRGAWGPSRTADARRRSLRAGVVPRRVFIWAEVAGALSMIALAAVWILVASVLRVAGGVLPNMSGYPRWSAGLAIGMGALISPLCEQAGIWGYGQSALERRWSGATAVMVASVAFALLPHPPGGHVFSTMSDVTRSILPAIPVHIVGLLMFFVLVWPRDAERPLILTAGTDAWFWLHLGQVVVFGALAIWAFGRLADATHRPLRRVESRDSRR
jgi:hypothetical protein